jgi:hypothetical protein
MNLESRTQLCIDFYSGAYGPTIRINSASIEGLCLLRGWFKKLAEESTIELAMSTAREVSLSGISDLVLRVLPASQERPKSLERTGLTGRDPEFVWARSPEGWWDCVGLVDGLMEANSAGHQYLTTEGVDDALVEASFSAEGSD